MVKKMDRIQVSSSNVASIGYDSDNMILEVEFLSGGLYEYYNVPEFLFNDFINSPSKGQFFDQHIKKAGFQFSKK
jgi:hypothetical protein